MLVIPIHELSERPLGLSPFYLVLAGFPPFILSSLHPVSYALSMCIAYSTRGYILCTDDVLLVIYLNLSFNLYSLFSLFRADIWWLGAGGSGLKRNKKLKGREQEKCTEEVCSDSFLETGNTLGNKVKTSFTLIYLFIRFRLGHQLDSFRDIGTAFLRYTNYWVISFLFSTSRY